MVSMQLRFPDMVHARKIALAAATLACAVLPLLSQTAATSKLSFDVVSIKPSPPGSGPRGGGPRGDRFVMTGVTLQTLLPIAYQHSTPGMAYQFQIIGGPNWMDSDRFDIEAKADCSGGPITREQYQLMVQSLIEDRFRLKAHLETREVPFYSLVVGKDGPKIKAAPDQTPISPPGPPPPALCPPPVTVQPPTPAAPRAAPFDPTKMRGFTSFQYAPGCDRYGERGPHQYA